MSDVLNYGTVGWQQADTANVYSMDNMYRQPRYISSNESHQYT